MEKKASTYNDEELERHGLRFVRDRLVRVAKPRAIKLDKSYPEALADWDREVFNRYTDEVFRQAKAAAEAGDDILVGRITGEQNATLLDVLLLMTLNESGDE